MTPATRIAAHRGGALERPENTLGAFRYAIGLGVEEIEFDVHLAADDVPVVHHDPTLDRMTDATGPLRSRTLEALRAVQIAGAPGDVIPTLDATLEVIAASDIAARVEIKRDVDGRPYPGLEADVIAALTRFGLLDRATLTSFSADVLQSDAVRLAPLPKILLVKTEAFHRQGGLDGVVDAAAVSGTDHFALPIDALDIELVRTARGRGLTVSAFGAHDAGQIEKALALRLPVFTSDRPHLAREIRAGRA